MLNIDDILKLLEDGKWHDMQEIIADSKFQDLKVKVFMGFLSEYNFVELDKKRQRVKLTPSLFEFFRKIRLLEEKEALGS